MKKILLTGSCGFIGTNFVESVIPKFANKYEFISIDRLVDSYCLNNIPKNHKFYLGDIADPHFINRVFQIERPNIILHFAAESFVDTSIENPTKFSHSNVYGTQVLVEASVKYQLERFLYVSTDEIMGQLLSKEDPSWKETDHPNPRNNYSASKLGGELLVRSANQVHGLNFNITRCCNNLGKHQPYRNLFPKIVINILKDRPIPIHGIKGGEAIREWINPIDHSLAIMKVLESGETNEIYNVGTGEECTNLHLVRLVGEVMGKKPKIEFVSERKGQDFRYSVDSSKLRSLGWRPTVSFIDNIKESIDWYRDNLELFQNV